MFIGCLASLVSGSGSKYLLSSVEYQVRIKICFYVMRFVKMINYVYVKGTY